jgi:hypothetical protein
MASPIASAWSHVVGLFGPMNAQLLLSVGSACLTGYYWLLKVGKERAGLTIYRTDDFKPDRPQGSRTPGKETAVWYGGLCLANPATVPAVVVRAEVRLLWDGGWVEGRLVQDAKDGPPWTVEPLRIVSHRLGLAFPVPEGTPRERLLGPQRFQFTLVTSDGRKRVRELRACDPPPAAGEVPTH